MATLHTDSAIKAPLQFLVARLGRDWPGKAAFLEPDDLAGSVRINLRLDSRVNDRLREFREHAALLLGRPVSVAEAINACIYVMNREV